MQQIPILELFLRFRACCSRALEASLALVSACSGINTKQLEQMYRDLCSEESGDGFLALDGEMELDEDLDEGGFENGDNCMGFLQQLQDETNLMKDDPEQKIPAKQEDKMPDLEGVPDSKQLRDIVSASCPTDPFRLENSVSPKKKRTDMLCLARCWRLWAWRSVGDACSTLCSGFWCSFAAPREELIWAGCETHEMHGKLPKD